jgi:hypothetical protein
LGYRARTTAIFRIALALLAPCLLMPSTEAHQNSIYKGLSRIPLVHSLTDFRVQILILAGELFSTHYLKLYVRSLTRLKFLVLWYLKVILSCGCVIVPGCEWVGGAVREAGAYLCIKLRSYA